jgi:hypothetical protein
MNELKCNLSTEEEFDSFKEKAKIEGLYNSFIPMPKVLENTRSPHLDPDAFIAQVNSSQGTNFLTLEGILLAGDERNASVAKGLIQNLKAFEETGYYEWKKWCENNWGVKWDASHVKVISDPDFCFIIFEFDSPWDSPNNFVLELSKMYPNAEFELITGSIESDFHYEYRFINGKIEYIVSYDTFKEAVENGNWGGMKEWADIFEDADEEEDDEE